MPRRRTNTTEGAPKGAPSAVDRWGPTPLEPKMGQMMHAYWSDKERFGWRCYLVICVGRKWITLFSAAGLETVRLSFTQWEALDPVYITFDRPLYIASLKRKIEQYTTLEMQFSLINAEKALYLLEHPDAKQEKDC